VQGDNIDVAWSDRRLEKSCSSESAGARRWGADHWTLLKRRLATLRAAPTLKDMDHAPGNCHALSANRAGQFAVYLWGQYRLIFVPNHDPVPRADDGSIKPTDITRITITEVVDYHGD
jgi:proteic killer suppression protein